MSPIPDLEQFLIDCVTFLSTRCFFSLTVKQQRHDFYTQPRQLWVHWHIKSNTHKSLRLTDNSALNEQILRKPFVNLNRWNQCNKETKTHLGINSIWSSGQSLGESSSKTASGFGVTLLLFWPGNSLIWRLLHQAL